MGIVSGLAMNVADDYFIGSHFYSTFATQKKFTQAS
jgi:hypothetical protein